MKNGDLPWWFTKKKQIQTKSQVIPALQQLRRIRNALPPGKGTSYLPENLEKKPASRWLVVEKFSHFMFILFGNTQQKKSKENILEKYLP